MVARRHGGAELRQLAHVEARQPALTPGTHTVTAKVVDPTTFVRDPAIQNGTALTQTLTWTVKDSANAPGAAEPARSRAARRTSARSAATTSLRRHLQARRRHVPVVTWKLDGTTVPAPNDGRTLRLAVLALATARTR